MHITIDQFLRATPHDRLMIFYGWLGEQPRETKYCFASIGNCAMCQFAKAMFPSTPWISAGARHVSLGEDGPESVVCHIFGKDNSPLVFSSTLGELHDKLTPILAPWMSPPMLPVAAIRSDAELDAIELRPLVTIPAKSIAH